MTHLNYHSKIADNKMYILLSIIVLTSDYNDSKINKIPKFYKKNNNSWTDVKCLQINNYLNNLNLIPILIYVYNII